VVKQAGGVIDFESEVGRGTTFRIHLPRIAGSAAKLTSSDVESSPPTGDETVLFVEDEDSVRELVSRALQRLGYEVLSAPNGGEAFLIAERREGRIDLLLTDVVMPGINGRELAERLAKLHPEMKVLFTSGYTDDVMVRHGVIDGNLHFIGKPYSTRTLATKLREILDG
jgi:DNA-binding NtrC family response regulator